MAGVLRHDRSKGHALINKPLGILPFDAVGQAALQHWSGVYTFAAGFRRTLFSVLQEIVGFICSYEDTEAQRKVLSVDVVDEILCGACLLPLARVNLRAPLRPTLSITDASERGGSAAAATSFIPSLSRLYGDQVASSISVCNEQSARKR